MNWLYDKRTNMLEIKYLFICSVFSFCFESVCVFFQVFYKTVIWIWYNNKTKIASLISWLIYKVVMEEFLLFWIATYIVAYIAKFVDFEQRYLKDRSDV